MEAEQAREGTIGVTWVGPGSAGLVSADSAGLGRGLWVKFISLLGQNYPNLCSQELMKERNALVLRLGLIWMRLAV